MGWVCSADGEESLAGHVAKADGVKSTAARGEAPDGQARGNDSFDLYPKRG